MPSTVIQAMEYDPVHRNLVVSFVSGLVYVYKEVPEAIYHAMKTSGAKGVYLNQNIKGKYEYEKIERPIGPG